MVYVSNNKRTVETPTITFFVEQRNFGFAENDGRWLLTQLPELYWSAGGCLRQRRPGTFLGVFDDMAAVETAIANAPVQPIEDVPVTAMGRVSC